MRSLHPRHILQVFAAAGLKFQTVRSRNLRHQFRHFPLALNIGIESPDPLLFIQRLQRPLDLVVKESEAEDAPFGERRNFARQFRESFNIIIFIRNIREQNRVEAPEYRFFPISPRQFKEVTYRLFNGWDIRLEDLRQSRDGEIEDEPLEPPPLQLNQPIKKRSKVLRPEYNRRGASRLQRHIISLFTERIDNIDPALFNRFYEPFTEESRYIRTAGSGYYAGFGFNLRYNRLTPSNTSSTLISLIHFASNLHLIFLA